MYSSIRVAICGARPSGLSQLHAFESPRQNTNLPKVCLEYVDYTYDKHFGQSVLYVLATYEIILENDPNKP
ncbi:unnamed protein product [Adineta steineri]|uniref:Uncharacterized protein n=1 Tax=Adineta steineri TaxID=433720 RepID=A0A819MP85_9BILA|nr:unnamed protein product [Adineta steineri]